MSPATIANITRKNAGFGLPLAMGSTRTEVIRESLFVLYSRPKTLDRIRDRRGFRRLEPELHFVLGKEILGHRLLGRFLRLDELDALRRHVAGHARAAAVRVDLPLDHRLDFAEVGRHV